MPQCDRCGTQTKALHSGGDAEIPEPGVCATCEQIIASIGIKNRQALIEKQIAAGVGARSKPIPGLARDAPSARGA